MDQENTVTNESDTIDRQHMKDSEILLSRFDEVENKVRELESKLENQTGTLESSV